MEKINVTVWNEYCREKLDKNVAEIHPKRIHGAIGKPSYFPNINEGIRAQRVVDAMLKSAETEMVVRL